MIRHEKAKTMGFFFFLISDQFLGFRIFLYKTQLKTLYNDDSQLCYKRLI